jgi:hypothetical protein
MQDDDSLLQSFVTIKPAAEKILSDGTDVDGTAKYRTRKNRESCIFIGIIFSPHKRISSWHLTVFESLHRLKNFQTLDVGGGIFTSLSLEIQFKHTFNSSIL